ncbi:MAG: plasmid mobilization relaxosome protein MobC [Eubacteriales bacterium]|nr:plasmid mobilization relaxosome protein MobC [Eubacteriales bacterium]MDD4474386.1 plasmid mobilization relaxosome protein MobC [Eubacteriales bacterium]
MRERNNGVLIYFSPNELAQLDEKVKKTNYTRTQFIRSVIADVKIKEAPPTDFFILIREIRRVGNNINQLLALANSKGLIISDELRSSLDKLDKTVQMMWDTFRSEIA